MSVQQGPHSQDASGQIPARSYVCGDACASNEHHQHVCHPPHAHDQHGDDDCGDDDGDDQGYLTMAFFSVPLSAS